VIVRQSQDQKGEAMIDWARVADLHGEIGDDAFAEVLELFVQEVDEGLDRLRSAGTARARMAEFHFLKGAALNLGLTELAECCSRGEAMAGQDQNTDAELAKVASGFPKANAILMREWEQNLRAA
jgi:histidine phosphotransfer protein HptB